MRRVILISALILSIFCLSSCLVISCEERKCLKSPDATHAPVDKTVEEVHIAGA
jgi:hypothetical protein